MSYKQTAVIQIDPIHPEAERIEQAASLLRAGELVVFPTETVYGLGADALKSEAVEQIFTVKGRPYSDPLIAHIASVEMLDQLTTHISEQARQLVQTFWPGPLTLILPAGPQVPKLVTAGLSTVAVRMPRHPVALALIRTLRSPIAAPSANRFMHVSPTTAWHAYTDLNRRVPLILDGGPCEVGVESTILDLCTNPPIVLRPGGIHLEALRAILPSIQLSTSPKAAHDQEAQRAPGQMPVHYAPGVPAYLFEGTVDQMYAAMLREVQKHQSYGELVGVLIADEDVSIFQKSGAHIYALGSTPEQIATHLFAGLRVLEESGVQVILCRSFEKQGIGLAIQDRLLKATGGKILKL